MRYRNPLEKGVLQADAVRRKAPSLRVFIRAEKLPPPHVCTLNVPPPRLYFKGVPPALDVRRVGAVRGSALCVRVHSLHWLNETCLIYKAATARRYGIKFDYRFCAKRIGGSL